MVDIKWEHKGNERGEWTYTGGSGESVIDYVIGNEETRERVERFVVKNKVDSDHQPVTEGRKKFEGVFGEGKGVGGGGERGMEELEEQDKRGGRKDRKR